MTLYSTLDLFSCRHIIAATLYSRSQNNIAFLLLLITVQSSTLIQLAWLHLILRLTHLENVFFYVFEDTVIIAYGIIIYQVRLVR